MDWCNCGGSSLAVNPLDKKWQKSRDFNPDKEERWEGRPFQLDEWLMSNTAIRGELNEMRSAITALVDREELHLWESESIKRAWVIHKEHVSSNLSKKNDVVLPLLEQRIHMDETLVRGRAQLLQIMESLEEEIASIDPDKKMKDVLNAFEKYAQRLVDHLNKEEITEVVLMRAYFSPEEVKPMVNELLGSSPAGATGSLIYFAGDEGFFKFMELEGISSFSWYFSLKFKRDSFDSNFIQTLGAVVHGVPKNSC